MVERGVMDQWPQHTAYCMGWVAAGKRQGDLTREGDLTWDCWMDLKADGSTRSGKDCVLENGEKQATDVAT